jgi:TetR/AcrR family transcriptional regulator
MVSSAQLSPRRAAGSYRARRRFLARRLEILRAAGALFRTHGFAEAGMREIAEAAALSPGNLYNYFQGKDEIVFFCQDNSLDRMIRALEEARRARISATGKLHAVMVAHVQCVLEEVGGSAAHLLTGSLPARLQRGLLAKRDRYEDGIRQLIAMGIRNGEFAARDPALMTRAILGALNWTVRWFNPAGELTVDEIAEGLADYLIRGLLLRSGALRQTASGRSAQGERNRASKISGSKRPAAVRA